MVEVAARCLTRFVDDGENSDFFVREFAVGRRIQLWESITALAGRGEITWDFSAVQVRRSTYLSVTTGPVPRVGGYVLPLGAIISLEKSGKSLKLCLHRIDSSCLVVTGHTVMMTCLWP